ncbi:FliH/SctL family protein [Acidovorax cavernicola]|nr:FliH/SctL family protein [Acidovorax cavernicola]
MTASFLHGANLDKSDASSVSSESPVRVLRDVIVQGQVSPGRPRPVATDASRAVHEPAVRLAVPRTPAAVPAAATSPAPTSASAVPVADTATEEAGYRAGHEEGLAKGLAEGRVRAAEEARQASELASRKAEQALAEHSEKLSRELTQQAQVAYQARVKVLAQLLEALPQRIEERLVAVEDDMLALSFEAVCRVLGEHVATAEGLRSQLLQSVRALRGRRLVAVHLHPDDLATLRREPAQDEVFANDDIQWIADAEMVLGGCIVRSPEGGLDARLEAQLEVLRHLLLRSRAATGHTAAGDGT